LTETIIAFKTLVEVLFFVFDIFVSSLDVRSLNSTTNSLFGRVNIKVLSSVLLIPSSIESSSIVFN